MPGGPGGAGGKTSFFTLVGQGSRYCHFAGDNDQSVPPAGCNTPDGADGMKGMDGNSGGNYSSPDPIPGTLSRPAFKDLSSVFSGILDSNQMSMVSPISV